MKDNLKSIQKQVDALKNNLLNVWNLEGKWDLENPEAPYNGMENDPIINLILTAVVYESNLLKDELNTFHDKLIDDCLDLMLPYNLACPVPAMALMESYPNKGKKSIILDDSTRFMIKKKNSKAKTPLSFYPILKTKLVNAKIENINRVSDNTWNVDLYLQDSDDSLAGITFYFDDMHFADIKVSHKNKEIPIIKPWELDKLPLNSMFSTTSCIYNSSMVYGLESQWYDLLAKHDMNLFMIQWSYEQSVGDNLVHLVFEFDDCASDMYLDNENLHINCFPIVNVILNNSNNSLPFLLSESKPIVCISNDNWSINNDIDDTLNEAPNFFMNLVSLEGNEYRYKDKFILRRFGTERFNLNELLVLAKKLIHKYQTDFYAFQSIEQLQNSIVIQKFDDVLKEIIDIFSKQKEPNYGVYAILKHTRSNSTLNNAIKINALFTNGSYANCNDRDVSISTPSNLSNILDNKNTRILSTIAGGKDPIKDTDVKQQLAKYYILTNDRIVTRNDLRSFVTAQLATCGINENSVKNITITNSISDNLLIQNVEIELNNNVKNNNISVQIGVIEKLANLRCANGCTIRISIKNI
ncbi:MAG: hypothetical protein II817_10280 [Bacteroidales bacterium]|nr:hypothetical protein [Bacteroidales bacterium]